MHPLPDQISVEHMFPTLGIARCFQIHVEYKAAQNSLWYEYQEYAMLEVAHVPKEPST